jgi:hypothetical protein
MHGPPQRTYGVTAIGGPGVTHALTKPAVAIRDNRP